MTIEGSFPYTKSDTECQHQIIIIIIIFEEAVFHRNEDVPFKSNIFLYNYFKIHFMVL